METDDVPDGAPTADTAARVREVIAAAGVSQREFARRVVMDPSKLSRSLSGTRRFTAAELARIADEGRVDVGRLLGARPREKATAPAVGVEGGRPLQIVRETVRLIAEHGFHAVRVADIARACATSSAAIHYHFPGRAELLEAAVRWCMDEDTARRAALIAEADDAAAELRQLVALQTPRTAQQRRQWAVWLDLWAEAARSTAVGRLHSEYYRQWRETVADVVRRGVTQGVFRAGTDPQAAALTLTALIDGLATHVLSVSGPSADRAADAMHTALTAHITHTILAPRP
ncbi:TetR family transcriptional regulator C-terminal domain-containing protein [Streptomyces coelicoflavus]|uniref:TetR/AcrR family transcriptional regulator n=1 Tax=Streptomyces TaxID=1883 RepID=UPI0012911F5B|nr:MULTISPECIES: TetR/AcrR family transcriptional regulator [Streptomyces]MCX5040293.1 TetR family transcriptional regulator C-terminal domain-containing protein [Streptomyces coelicoflavus]QFX80783.1 TetR family transcriptional regulator [Streptomyces sp. SYP-A7193]